MLTWVRSRPVRHLVFASLCLLVVGTRAIVIANRRMAHADDFDVSREFGRRFLTGEQLYASGLQYPYMPVAAMYFAPLALVPPNVGIAIRYGVALACLWLTLRLLHAMPRGRSETIAARQFLIAVITLALGSHYVIRDLDDGGPPR